MSRKLNDSEAAHDNLIADDALRDDIIAFQTSAVEQRVLKASTTDHFEDCYFEWYNALRNIGCGAVTQALLLEQYINDEYTTRASVEQAKAKLSLRVVKCNLKIIVIIVREVLHQLKMKTRDCDTRFPYYMQLNLRMTCDLIVVRYADYMNMRCSDHVHERCTALGNNTIGDVVYDDEWRDEMIYFEEQGIKRYVSNADDNDIDDSTDTSWIIKQSRRDFDFWKVDEGLQSDDSA